MTRSILFLGYGPAETTLIDFAQSAGHTVIWTDQKRSDLSEADLVVSFGYRHILTADHLATAKARPVNLHISYLPYNRGAHPNFWSWIDGTPAGVTLHEIDPGLDTGPIIAQEKLEGATPEMSFSQTYGMLKERIEALFRSHFRALLDGSYEAVAQPKRGTYHAAKDLPDWMTDWSMPIAEAKARWEAGQ